MIFGRAKSNSIKVEERYTYQSSDFYMVIAVNNLYHDSHIDDLN